MAIETVFLGWDRSPCETVAARLLEEHTRSPVDLRDTVVVVPTRQAGWRLRGWLPIAAHERGLALLGPEIVTPPVLLEPPPTANAATLTDELVAWHEALTAMDPEHWRALSGPSLRATPSGPMALSLGMRLRQLRAELIEGGFTIADVAARTDLTDEVERWAALAEVERRYVEALKTRGRLDRVMRQADHIRAGSLPPCVRRVILAALPDPPDSLLRLLETWSAKTGGLVEAWAAAPADLRDAFDPWGRPLPDLWQTREIELPNCDILLESTPEAEARRVVDLLRGAGIGPDSVPKGRSPDLALGVCDPEAVTSLVEALSDLGLSVFDPRDRPLRSIPLYRLVESLLDLRRSSDYPVVSRFLRHPDLLATVDAPRALLTALDTVQSEYLPPTLDELIRRLDGANAPSPASRSALAEMLRRVDSWRQTLQTSPLARALRQILREIYAARTLNRNRPEDHDFEQAAAVLDAALRELDPISDLPGELDPSDLLRARLRDARVRPERRGELLDLEGWLELGWNPSPFLFVVGFNEGLVPDGRVGDAFLPDALRTRLGLRDDRRRAARDAYLLTAIVQQRRHRGHTWLLLAKTTNNGDPLRPSRLLFQCPDGELVPRVRRLFAAPAMRRPAAARTVGFQLDPRQVPLEPAWRTPPRVLHVTSFRSYLECPLRFYFTDILEMQPLDDLALEPGPEGFGLLIHQVLSDMAADPGRPWACGDADRLARWLEERLRERAREHYGEHPWLGVRLAVESAVRRLRAFAIKQIEWHARGWDLLGGGEQPFEIELEGCRIRGRIDRIDRHRGTGGLCVFDYKTSDEAEPPSKWHVRTAPPIPHLPEADDPPVAETRRAAALRGSVRRWVDLQLPLYREMLSRSLPDAPPAQVGFIQLPRSPENTQFVLWETYEDRLHAHAISCARAVVRAILAGRFWPPLIHGTSYEDPLYPVCLDDPERTLVPPIAHWRTS